MTQFPTWLLGVLVLAQAGKAAPTAALLGITAEGGVSAPAAAVVTERVTSGLRRSGKFGRVFSVDEVSLATGGAAAGCADLTCTAEMAGALGADLVVTGTVRHLDEAWMVSVKLIHARDGITLGAGNRVHQGGDEGSLVDLADGAVKDTLDVWQGVVRDAETRRRGPSQLADRVPFAVPLWLGPLVHSALLAPLFLSVAGMVLVFGVLAPGLARFAGQTFLLETGPLAAGVFLPVLAGTVVLAGLEGGASAVIALLLSPRRHGPASVATIAGLALAGGAFALAAAASGVLALAATGGAAATGDWNLILFTAFAGVLGFLLLAPVALGAWSLAVYFGILGNA